MRCTGFLVASVCAGMVLLVPPPATAKGKDSKESKEKAAKKACLLGEVDKGAEILADLYVETNNPTYVYNQGRCFEQNGRNEQALLRLKEYERKAQGLSQADVDALHKKIEDLQAATGQGKTEPPAPPAAPVPPPVAPSYPPVPPPGPADAHGGDPLGIRQAGPPPQPEATPVYKRWWFWTAVGVLVAGGVATGIVLSRQSAPSSPSCDGAGACVP